MINQQHVRNRVTNGAKLLDERRPGWANKIHLDGLNMRSITHCILGQLYGGLGPGVLMLDLSTNKTGLYGFFLWDAETTEGIHDYRKLTAWWQDETMIRRAS